MSRSIVQIDAFTSEPFRGNPAAVCVMESEGDAEWMQCVAREMNLAETAFVVPRSDGFGLRWFTPTTEVDLCGHATLASAHALWESGRVEAAASISFHTRSGLLTATRDGDRIALDFPAESYEAVEPDAGVVDALGVRALEAVYSARLGIVSIVVENADVVKACAPDIAALAGTNYDAVMISSNENAGAYDFVSRFFAPRMGIDEDPVTGAAHCILGPYWADRLGKRELRAYQASARGGAVGVEVRGDRVTLLGQAVTVLRGELV